MAVLEQSAPQTAAAEFERLDAEAIRAQAEFRRTAGRANRTVLATAVLGAALLLAGALEEWPAEDVRRGLLLAIGAAGIVSGGLGTMWLLRLKQGDLFERWMRARAGAETRRLQYFERVTEAEGASDPPMPLPLLQLEYFRRYQLDVEIAFYRERQRDHSRAADRTLQLESIAIFAATVGTGLGGLAAGLTEPYLAAAGAIGVAGAAGASFAGGRETITQDRRNAERYARTLEALVALRERLDEVRAAAGSRGPVVSFVTAVNDQISLEHRQWLDTVESIEAGITRLEAALARHTQDPDTPPSA